MRVGVHVADDPRLKTRARRRLRATKAIGEPPCWRCGGAIDYGAPRWEPASYHLDEIVPRHAGGDPLDPANTAPAHASCNTSAGGRAGNMLRLGRMPDPDPEPLPITQW